jgi:UDP-N-acetylglucosamine--N-acetylmuramyl-(pentapeptide) pyrophosphoryl-undecaprenol N-acetylglucosamine transferase
MSAGPIMIMAGGTGGHVFPGLAVAEILLARNHPVVWLGTRRGLEATLIPASGIEIEWISIGGIRRSGWLAWALAPFRIARAVVQALGVLRRRRPAAVLGFGGFVSGPGGFAAWCARKPLAIHEQNAVAGTANRVLARFADRIFEAFPGSFAPRFRAETIGNPIRRPIAALAGAREERARADTDAPHLLVMGGSQGALALNRTVPEALALLPPAARPRIRHQAGRTLAEAKAAYAACGVEAETVAFIDDMAAAYVWADLVIARAGAISLAELAAAGVGSILVPLPTAVDDHQTKNAAYFADAGASVVVPQAELDAKPLAALLGRLLSDRGRLAQMGRQARMLARPDAAERLADACTDLAEGRQ